MKFVIYYDKFPAEANIMISQYLKVKCVEEKALHGLGVTTTNFK
jgi:hypothetical protein